MVEVVVEKIFVEVVKVVGGQKSLLYSKKDFFVVEDRRRVNRFG